MRLVIVESPFAPQTPLKRCEREAMCGSRCDNVFVPFCAGCLSVQTREKEAARNARYLDAALLDCLRRGEAPFASHAIYTRAGVLDDMKPDERSLGIVAGFAWRKVAHLTAFYVDLGWSPGMRAAEADVNAFASGPTIGGYLHDIEIRRLGGDWEIK